MRESGAFFLKKWVWLFALTAVCIGLLGGLYVSRRPAQVNLKVAYLQSGAVAQTVTCNGRVEAAGENEVQVAADCVVEDVLVKEGQQVEKGDTLFTVDKEATLSVLAQSDSAVAVQSAMSDALPTTVTAPAGGIVKDLRVSAGDLAESGATCATIATVSPVQIRLSIPERSIRRVAVGQPVIVSGMGFAAERYAGEITEIAKSAKQEVGTAGTETLVEAVVSLKDGAADASLRNGLTAKAVITVAVTQNSFLVPYDAVLEDEDNREYIYIYKDAQVEKRVITPQAELKDGYLVTEGVENGEQLVCNPEAVSERAVYTAEEKDHD